MLRWILVSQTILKKGKGIAKTALFYLANSLKGPRLIIDAVAKRGKITDPEHNFGLSYYFQ